MDHMFLWKGSFCSDLMTFQLIYMSVNEVNENTVEDVIISSSHFLMEGQVETKIHAEVWNIQKL